MVQGFESCRHFPSNDFESFTLNVFLPIDREHVLLVGGAVPPDISAPGKLHFEMKGSKPTFGKNEIVKM